MKCTRCGEKVTAEDRFCPKCGMEVSGIKQKAHVRKKVLCILAAFLAVALVAGIGAAVYFKGQSTKRFLARLGSFQDYCGKSRMGDLTGEYEELVGRAEDAAQRKDQDAYAALEEEFEQFQSTLDGYLEKVDGYLGKEDEYAAMFEKLSLGDSQKSAYSSAMEELAHSMEEGSLQKLEESVAKLDAQYKKCESKNRAKLKKDKKELEGFAAAGLLNAEQQIVKGYEKKAAAFLDDKDYRNALKEYKKCRDFCENTEKTDQFQFEVEQVDALGFPQIKLYISALEKQTGTEVAIAGKGLKLRELSEGTYHARDIARVERLDGKEQLSTCLVADVSGSMYDQLEMAKDAMRYFVSCMQYGAGDRCALITFDNYVRLDQDFTGDKQELDSAIQSMYVGNSTALYDALYVAVCKASGSAGAKCVIAFTDGYDNVSTKTENDVISAASAFEVPIYLIGIGNYVDESAMKRISSATGGYYRNIYDASMMQEVYDSIYGESKDLYLVEYTTQAKDRDAVQELYLSYEAGDAFMRCESSFTPSELQAEDTQYAGIIQNGGITNDMIEDEVLRIRAIYNEIVQNVENGWYVETKPQDGVTAYEENGDVRCVVIRKGIGGSPYARYYYYEGGELIFAYIEAADSHRLYFKDDAMFRWRYASDAVKYTEADNHDNEDSAEFRTWEAFALGEAYLYN